MLQDPFFDGVFERLNEDVEVMVFKGGLLRIFGSPVCFEKVAEGGLMLVFVS